MSHSNIHVRNIYRVVFDSSHFLLQVANLSSEQISLNWVTVASPDASTTTELPAHLIHDLRLPNGDNLIRRVVLEEREVPLKFLSASDARTYALENLGLMTEDEATAEMVAGRQKQGWFYTTLRRLHLKG